MYVDAITLGTWSFHGDQTTIDLIAASTNALNGAILGFVAPALLAAVLWIVGDAIGLPAAVASAIAIAFSGSFAFRVAALYLGWEEPLAAVPKGVRLHDDKRPLLGRKLHHKSVEELRVLGLAVDEPDDG